MAVPSAVRKAGEASDKLMQETLAKMDGKSPAPNTDGDRAGNANTVATDKTVNTDGNQDNKPKGDDDPNSETWKSRFEVLTGKYNAEVPRLHNDLRTARDQNAQLNKQMVDLRSEVNDLRKTVTEVKPVDMSDGKIGNVDLGYIKEEHGDEMAQVVATLASQVREATARADKLQGRLEEVSTDVTASRQSQHLTAENEYYADVGKAHPDYLEVNKKQAWLDYLTNRDPMSGKTRQQLLDDAHNALDSVRVIAIFQDFKDSQGADTDTHNELDEQLLPGGGGSGGSGDGEKPVWKRSQITEFYKERAKKNGRYRGTPEKDAEGRRIESEISEAAQAGRVLEG